MKIVFSRHAKRRAKLYDIQEAKVSAVLASAHLRRGEQVIMRTVPGIPYPLKIVVAVEDDVVTVITAYPLRKGKRK